ncbi:MAG TPA: hypothetical protein VHV83_10830 [Armatimonadota bacterium]|nr:hypothetical protein [Armatimonadota bacterium]
MRKWLTFLLVAVPIVFLAVLTGCSDDNNNVSPASVVAVTIDPTEATVPVSTSTLFTATVTGTSNRNVTWSVSEDNGGTITQGGLYTAPVGVGTYHVIARSQADQTKFATATVTVTDNAGGITVTVSPTTADVPINGVQHFTATVTGTSNTDVTWSVSEPDGGEICNLGNYMAPSEPGIFHVVATSVADPSKFGVAEVNVTDQPISGISVSITPSQATIPINSNLQLTATVAGTTNTAVNWYVWEENGGTVDQNGLYTAPGITGTFHVLAYSAEDPNIGAVARITITDEETPAVTGVTLDTNSITLSPNGTHQFTAIVSATGSASTDVTWSITEGSSGESITQGGFYTAPSTTGVYHVKATSTFDPTKYASATITVSTNQSGDISVTVSPQYATVSHNNTKQFTATVNGTTDQQVTWRLVESSCGQITADGVYIPPDIPGTFHIKAISVADPSKYGCATVTVY